MFALLFYLDPFWTYKYVHISLFLYILGLESTISNLFYKTYMVYMDSISYWLKNYNTEITI